MAVQACSTAHLSQPELCLPKTYEGLVGNSRSADQDIDRWWLLFKDPELDQIIAEALAASPDAKSAYDRMVEARATRVQTLSAYQLRGDPGASAQDQYTSESSGGLGAAEAALGGLGGGLIATPGDLQTYAAQFNITYVLDLFGRGRVARRGADADVAAQRFDYEATRATLATNVAIALFQARGDAIQLADAKETLRIAVDLAKVGRVSSARGLTATSDAARLETDLETAKAEVDRLTALAQASKRSLLTLMGHGFDPSGSIDIEAVAAAPPPLPAATPGDLLRRRPDIREAEARLRSAAANLALDRLALFPSFILAPGVELAKEAGSYSAVSTIWTAGLNASAPLLDRPRLLAVIKGTRAKGEEAVNAYEKSVQSAYRDAENGLTTVAADINRNIHLKAAADQAKFAFTAKRRGYELGLTDLTTLLEAERTWRQSQSAYTAGQTQALVDAATLFQALGGGWSPGSESPHDKAKI